VTVSSPFPPVTPPARRWPSDWSTRCRWTSSPSCSAPASYFGRIDAQHLLEDSDVVIQGERVLHLRYPIRR
jgi:hypothetical protein